MLAQLISPVTGLLDKFIEDKDQKAALAHEISTMAERHAQELAMSQIKVNQEEAKSGSLFIGGWRPFVGWICGIALLYHFILQGNKMPGMNGAGIWKIADEKVKRKMERLPSRYFDAIRKSLSNSSGQEEIMKDIEMRVAELFTERQKSDKQVINIKDVDEVVKVMGQPEDYIIEDDSKAESNYQAYKKSKKLTLN